MALRSISTRRLVRPLAVLAIAGTGLLGFAGHAHAASEVGPITAGACTGGTVNRSVTVNYFTDASFTTAFRIHVVSGTPGGPTIRTIERPFAGPTTPGERARTSISIDLPAGTYYFDWEDADGGGVWSGRHSGLGDYYEGVYISTRTVVEQCVIETTTTAAPPTTATTPPTTAAPTTTAAATTTVAVGVPTTQTAATTSTTVAVNVPTTAVVQTTAAASGNTLPATGANSTPLVAAGVMFLGLGTVAVLSTRRRRPATQL